MYVGAHFEVKFFLLHDLVYLFFSVHTWLYLAVVVPCHISVPCWLLLFLTTQGSPSLTGKASAVEGDERS